MSAHATSALRHTFRKSSKQGPHECWYTPAADPTPPPPPFLCALAYKAWAVGRAQGRCPLSEPAHPAAEPSAHAVAAAAAAAAHARAAAALDGQASRQGQPARLRGAQPGPPHRQPQCQGGAGRGRPCQGCCPCCAQARGGAAQPHGARRRSGWGACRARGRDWAGPG